MQTDTNPAAGDFSFRRQGDDWVAIGDGGRAGRVVGIRRRNGETAFVILTVPAAPGWYFVNAGDVVEGIESRNQEDAALFKVDTEYRGAATDLSVRFVGETGHELELGQRRGNRLWTITAISAKPQHPGDSHSPWSYLAAAAGPTPGEAALYRAAEEGAREQERLRVAKVADAVRAWAHLDDDREGEMVNVWSLTERATPLVERPYGVWADFDDDTIRLIYTVSDEHRALIRRLPRTPARVAAVELLAATDPQTVEDARDEHHRLRGT